MDGMDGFMLCYDMNDLGGVDSVDGFAMGR